jgi:hypothetical protein
LVLTICDSKSGQAGGVLGSKIGHFRLARSLDQLALAFKFLS